MGLHGLLKARACMKMHVQLKMPQDVAIKNNMVFRNIDLN